MSTDLKALLSAIKLLADAAKDTKEVLTAGGSPIMAVLTYKNLLGDLMTLVPLLTQIPSEAKALTAPDYLVLVQSLMDDLGVTDAHAKSIIDNSMALFSELVTVVLPKIESLIGAVKNSPVADATTMAPVATAS